MITIGSVIRLHGAEDYRVDNFSFRVEEYSGSMCSFVTLTGLATNRTMDYHNEMILDLLRRGELYLVEQAEFYERLHKIRAEKTKQEQEAVAD